MNYDNRHIEDYEAEQRVIGAMLRASSQRALMSIGDRARWSFWHYPTAMLFNHLMTEPENVRFAGGMVDLNWLAGDLSATRWQYLEVVGRMNGLIALQDCGREGSSERLAQDLARLVGLKQARDAMIEKIKHGPLPPSAKKPEGGGLLEPRVPSARLGYEFDRDSGWRWVAHE